MRQLSFLNALPREHGGETTKGKRKIRRPFDSKQALHVVLRSSRARGQYSMLHPRYRIRIQHLVNRLKRRWNISVYSYANVGNHIHLLLRARSRSNWQGFIRELSGGIAMMVSGARKGNALNQIRTSDNPGLSKRTFWDHLVYTRIVSFGRDFKNVTRYVSINLWEGMGAPIRKIIARGYRIIKIGEDGGILVK
jgi:REP element-mobilizing transposase RayT